MDHTQEAALSQIVPGIRRMQLNPFTLSFSGENKHLEQKFKDYYFRKFLVQMRVGMLLAMVFYGLFAFLDAVMVPELKYTFWFIRFGVVLPLAFLSILFSFTRVFRTFHQPTLFLLILLGGSGIIAMIILATPPANYSYYAGLILVFIFGYTFIGLRCIWSTAAAWILIAAYQVVAIKFTETPVIILINNDFFFICASFFCMFAAYSMEYSARLDFYRARLLSQEKEQVEAARENLENEVQARTELLQKEVEEKNALLVEQERLHRQLTQAQKMEAIGTLAGGIAHDFNNILTPMLGFTELARRSPSISKELDEHLARVLKAGDRARDLVKRILAFSRQSDLEIIPVSTIPLIKEVIKLMRATIPTTIDIRLEQRASRDTIAVDPTQLHQVLINLCTNAAHAIQPSEGTITLCIEEVTLTGSDGPKELSQALPGDYLLIQVADTGTGMSEEIRDRIFEPFFTTKEPGSGTGMGLSVVLGIVQASGGHILVDSSPGKGSAFSLYFPLLDMDTADEDQANERERQTMEGTEHILVADDEPQILEMQRQVLTSMGYQVTVCSTGDKALRTFLSQPESFDLVVTDLTMPGLTGYKLAREIKQTISDLPVILCTGFAENTPGGEAMDDAIDAYLGKPMSMIALLTKIRELLDAKERV